MCNARIRDKCWLLLECSCNNACSTHSNVVHMIHEHTTITVLLFIAIEIQTYFVQLISNISDILGDPNSLVL